MNWLTTMDLWTSDWLQKKVLAPPCKIKAQDGESISVFIPFAKIEDEVKRKKETDDIGEP